jgi:quercetin 2,3-dioxygenase
MMKTISQGKIFLSDQRGVVENKDLKRYCSFNFEAFYNPAKEAVGNLYALHDDLLAPNASLGFYTQEKGYIIVLPITGTVNYFDEKENETDIAVGECLMVFAEKNSFIKLKNPYHDNLISYLVIGIKDRETQPFSPHFFNVDLSEVNQLKPVNHNTFPFQLNLGHFHGRGECKYALNQQSLSYLFVLSGAFEVEGRLLHERDGIALWDTAEIEIEALSHNAVILTIALAI